MAEEKSLKKKTFAGALWGAMERFSTQGISFVVMIIMARILTPADYGIVGMVLVFMNVAWSLVDSGFSQALIRKQDRSETDSSTTFYFNIAIGFLLYGVFWFIAPALARFYGEPRLVEITRVISLGVIFVSFAVVQRALLSVQLDFKRQAWAGFLAASAGGAAGITMAYRGWGVWSIVAYHVINLGANTLLLWLFSKWRPSWAFSWKTFRYLFSFGYKIALSGLLHTLYVNGYNMAIGKVYKAADLGYYTRGQQFVNFFSANVSGVLQKVTYPVLCRFQNDDAQLGDYFLKIVRVSCLMVFVLMMGMVGVAKPMIGMLLGERWLYAANLMQILCFGYMWFAVYSLNLNILLVKGRSDLYLRLEIVKKILFIGVICATIPFGLEMMCWGLVINSMLEVIINGFYTGKLIGISLWKQLGQLVPALVYAVATGAVTYAVAHFTPGPFVAQFFGGTLSGLLFFIIITKATGSADFRFLLSLIKRK